MEVFLKIKPWAPEVTVWRVLTWRNPSAVIWPVFQWLFKLLLSVHQRWQTNGLHPPQMFWTYIKSFWIRDNIKKLGRCHPKLHVSWLPVFLGKSLDMASGLWSIKGNSWLEWQWLPLPMGHVHLLCPLSLLFPPDVLCLIYQLGPTWRLSLWPYSHSEWRYLCPGTGLPVRLLLLSWLERTSYLWATADTFPQSFLPPLHPCCSLSTAQLQSQIVL